MSRPNTTPQLAPLSPADRAALVEIHADCFASSADGVTSWHERARAENIRALRIGERVVGGVIHIPMGQVFGGVVVPMVGIAGVAIATDARRRGLASAMMRETLVELHRQGVALSTLYASNQALYRRVGYEAAGARFNASIAPTAVRLAEPSSRDGLAVTALPAAASAPNATLDAEQKAWLARSEQVYARYALQHAGHLQRVDYIWRRLRSDLHGTPARGLLVCDAKSGAPEGSLYYRYEVSHPQDRHDVIVTDAAATSPRAWRRLWQALADMGPVVRRIRFNSAPTDPLYLALSHGPDAKMELFECWMLRIVSLEQAIARRAFSAALAPLQLSLEVIDPILEANAGRFSLTIADGGGAITRAPTKPEVRLDIRALAAIYSGFATAQTMAACGLIDGEPAAMQRLDAAFAGPSPWMREMF